MLAKLFNDISIASLIRSAGVVILLFVLVFLLAAPEQASLQLLQYHWEFSAIWLLIPGIPVYTFSVWWFNSTVNGVQLLKGDYQVMLVTGLLLLPALISMGSLNLMLLLPLTVLFLQKQFALGHQEDISYAQFDTGTIVGLMLILQPLSVVFLLINWLALMNYGRFGLKESLMPLTGALAVWFLVCSLIYFVAGGDTTLEALRSLLVISLGNFSGWQQKTPRLIPLILLMLPGFFELLKLFGKIKVLQRQGFTLLLLSLAVILLAGTVFYNPQGLWLWMALPAGVILVNLIQSIRRPWLKDVVYLLLLTYVFLFFF